MGGVHVDDSESSVACPTCIAKHCTLSGGSQLLSELSTRTFTRVELLVASLADASASVISSTKMKSEGGVDQEKPLREKRPRRPSFVVTSVFSSWVGIRV